MRLRSIHVHPVKSLRGFAVEEWALDELGLEHDRRYMVVRPDGMFVTQRELPKMALIETALDRGELWLSIGARRLRIVEPAEGPELEVRVWRSTVRARLVGEEADRWLSDVLGAELRLVFIPTKTVRETNPLYAPGARTGFADGYPLLVVGQASLDDLNARLAAASESPVPMDRFRPNLVVEGSPPFAEDDWRDFSIGDVPLRIVKPCARCVIVSTDQATAVVGKEPLRTLATYRKVGNDVLFGQNAIHLAQGRLRVGDPVVV